MPALLNSEYVRIKEIQLLSLGLTNIAAGTAFQGINDMLKAKTESRAP